MAAKTLFEKVWDAHVVRSARDEPDLLYVDLHLVHEVTTPQAFDGLKLAGRRVRRPDLTLATLDHNTPTDDLFKITDEVALRQIRALEQNVAEYGIRLEGIRSQRRGIVHIIGPELGLSQPGMTIVCGDSHTSTHGAMGALAFGIGTSEVEHVLGTQTLPQFKPKTMEVRVEGQLPSGVTAKDVILGIIGRIGIDAGSLAPHVTWGTNPGMVAPVTERVPDPTSMPTPEDREAVERALAYMDLRPGTALEDIALDRVFIGSCTNARIEDLRAAAKVARGRKVDPRVRAMVVPGSGLVKAQAEQEGLDQVFKAAGFEWREAGCSMCLGMNPDILSPGERCASTSNRNFEGRQGKGGRTHLVSPEMAAAAAVEGHFVDIREWD